MHLVLDHVPYELERRNRYTWVLKSPYYADLLNRKNDSCPEEHEGLWVAPEDSNQPIFVYVDSYPLKGEVVFRLADSKRVFTDRLLERFWSDRVYAIQENGYEALYPNK